MYRLHYVTQDGKEGHGPWVEDRQHLDEFCDEMNTDAGYTYWFVVEDAIAIEAARYAAEGIIRKIMVKPWFDCPF